MKMNAAAAREAERERFCTLNFCMKMGTQGHSLGDSICFPVDPEMLLQFSPAMLTSDKDETTFMNIRPVHDRVNIHESLLSPRSQRRDLGHSQLRPQLHSQLEQEQAVREPAAREAAAEEADSGGR